MKLTVVALAAVLGLLAAPPQDKGAKPAILWAKTWEAAMAEAAERNVPIYFTVHKDG